MEDSVIIPQERPVCFPSAFDKGSGDNDSTGSGFTKEIDGKVKLS